MFFNSIEEINWLSKEIHRLLSKGMSNFCLEVTFDEKNLRSQASFFYVYKNLCWVSFGELQLTILRTMGAFSLILILKEIMMF